MRHKKAFCFVGAIFLLICLLLNTIVLLLHDGAEHCSAISGSTYPSDDLELVAVEADYAARRRCKLRSTTLRSAIRDMTNTVMTWI